MGFLAQDKRRPMRKKNNGRKADIYLTGRVWRDELIIDLLGFGGQFGCFAFLEVLARQVEGDVLLTELWNQEGSEEAESIWAT